jgi:hypothetical protein
MGLFKLALVKNRKNVKKKYRTPADNVPRLTEMQPADQIRYYLHELPDNDDNEPMKSLSELPNEELTRIIDEILQKFVLNLTDSKDSFNSLRGYHTKLETMNYILENLDMDNLTIDEHDDIVLNAQEIQNLKNYMGNLTRGGYKKHTKKTKAKKSKSTQKTKAKKSKAKRKTRRNRRR